MQPQPSLTTAKIVWTTNEAASRQVEYGISTSYGSTTPLDQTLDTNHAVTLSGLTQSTTYHFRVKSADSAGNLAQSGDYTFATLAKVSTFAVTTSSTTAFTRTSISASSTFIYTSMYVVTATYSTSTAIPEFNENSNLLIILAAAFALIIVGRRGRNIRQE